MVKKASKQTAVVLFNLGGPDTQAAVKPFLFNLFNDPAIIGAPNPIRYLIAKLISSRREKKAQGIYAEMGGGSPILPLTQKQARALEKELGAGFKVFICMRYWHPMTPEVVEQVKKYAPDEIMLLPLYPQFSTTTTESSFDAWDKEAALQGLKAETRRICCYHSDAEFIDAHAALIKPFYAKAKKFGAPRILFSAHGLPKKVIEKGDPYQWQVEQTAAAVVKKLGIPNLDWRVCYQSKVGPLEWIGPATDAEIIRAAEEKKPTVLVPIAFVSEHSETLVELDIEYKHLAEEHGQKHYFRVPALGLSEAFISALAKRVKAKKSDYPNQGCPKQFGRCPCRN